MTLVTGGADPAFSLAPASTTHRVVGLAPHSRSAPAPAPGRAPSRGWIPEAAGRPLRLPLILLRRPEFQVCLAASRGPTQDMTPRPGPQGHPASAPAAASAPSGPKDRAGSQAAGLLGPQPGGGPAPALELHEQRREPQKSAVRVQVSGRSASHPSWEEGGRGLPAAPAGGEGPVSSRTQARAHRRHGPRGEAPASTPTLLGGSWPRKRLLQHPLPEGAQARQETPARSPARPHPQRRSRASRRATQLTRHAPVPEVLAEYPAEDVDYGGSVGGAPL